MASETPQNDSPSGPAGERAVNQPAHGMGSAHRWLLGLLVLALLLSAYTRVLDHPASSYADAALKRALVAYTVARSLNGVISVAQETEIALQPAGVGVTLTPGQLLDPVNDLVERFSVVMLASTVSIGVQQMLLSMSNWWGITALVTLAALAAALALLRPAFVSDVGRSYLLRFALLAALVRFGVPILLLATSAVSGVFLQPEQEAATEALRQSSAEIQSITQEVEAQAAEAPEAQSSGASASLVQRLQQFVGDKLPSADVQGRIEATREKLSSAVSHIINLIVTFTLETILLPLFVMWVLIRATRGLLRL